MKYSNPLENLIKTPRTDEEKIAALTVTEVVKKKRASKPKTDKPKLPKPTKEPRAKKPRVKKPSKIDRFL